jgi:hypothetical protein
MPQRNFFARLRARALSLAARCVALCVTVAHLFDFYTRSCNRRRCKVYRFEKDVYGGEERTLWKERGVGDLKIKKHSKTTKIRVLMRREKTLKICLNFYSAFMHAWQTVLFKFSLSHPFFLFAFF